MTICLSGEVWPRPHALVSPQVGFAGTVQLKKSCSGFCCCFILSLFWILLAWHTYTAESYCCTDCWRKRDWSLLTLWSKKVFQTAESETFSSQVLTRASVWCGGSQDSAEQVGNLGPLCSQWTKSGVCASSFSITATFSYWFNKHLHPPPPPDSSRRLAGGGEGPHYQLPHMSINSLSTSRNVITWNWMRVRETVQDFSESNTVSFSNHFNKQLSVRSQESQLYAVTAQEVLRILFFISSVGVN